MFAFFYSFSMEKLPFDVRLLRVGLEYCQLKAAEQELKHLFKEATSPAFSGHQNSSTYKNLNFIHALNKEDPPKVALKFGRHYGEVLHVDKETCKITTIVKNEDQDQNDGRVHLNKGLSSLDIMSLVVPYTIADAICDLAFHPQFHAADMTAFGQEGADNVMAFKTKWLGPSAKAGLAAYKLEDPFIVDLDELKVTLGFECIIQGHEGHGTDYVYVNENKKITRIDVVRDKK